MECKGAWTRRLGMACHFNRFFTKWCEYQQCSRVDKETSGRKHDRTWRAQVHRERGRLLLQAFECEMQEFLPFLYMSWSRWCPFWLEHTDLLEMCHSLHLCQNIAAAGICALVAETSTTTDWKAYQNLVDHGNIKRRGSSHSPAENVSTEACLINSIKICNTTEMGLRLLKFLRAWDSGSFEKLPYKISKVLGWVVKFKWLKSVVKRGNKHRYGHCKIEM